MEIEKCVTVVVILIASRLTYKKVCAMSFKDWWTGYLR